MEIYHWIDEERLIDAHQEEEEDGVITVVELSPYETPKRVSGDYRDRTGEFVITFHYINDEDASDPQTYQGVKVVEGKYSGKILQLILPIDTPQLDPGCIINLKSKAAAALEIRQQRILGKTDQELNQTVAQKVIEEDFAELVPG